MKLRFLILFFFCSFLFAQENISSKFKLVFKINNENIEKVKKSIEGKTYIYYEQMCIDTINNELSLGLLISNDDSKNKIIFVNQNGDILFESDYFDYIFDVIGEPAQFRYLNSKLYLAGYKEKSLLITGDTVKIVNSPWLEFALRQQYPGANFKYEVGFLGYSPLFKIVDNNLYTIELDGTFYQYKLEKNSSKLIAHYELPLPVNNLKDFLELWLDPIVGKYGNDIFLWGRNHELVYYNIKAKKLKSFSIKNLFSAYNIGQILTNFEEQGLSYYSIPNTFYIFVYTDKGIHIFRYE